jgi:hypothetical protein
LPSGSTSAVRVRQAPLIGGDTELFRHAINIPDVDVIWISAFGNPHMPFGDAR